MALCARCGQREAEPENRMHWCADCDQWRRDRINGFLNPSFTAGAARLSDADREIVEERAAIREFDGGLDRTAAERAAAGDVIVAGEEREE